MLFTKITIASILATLAVANPVPDREIARPIEASVAPVAARDEDEGLTKRATEGVHLTYCSGSNPYDLVVYCANDSNCNFYPAAANRCVFGSGGPLYTGTHSCTFSTGVTFSWTIVSDAYSRADYTVVGSGNNGSPWTIRKDDNHVMFNDPSGQPCYAEFYALK